MFAPLVLYGWPAVVMALFHKCRVSVAIGVAIVAGYLLLPTNNGLNLPLLPTLDKNSIPALAALVFGSRALAKRGPETFMPSWLPQGFSPRLCLFGFVFGAFMTVVTNGDLVQFPTFSLPGLRLYDGFSAVLSAIVLLLPFFLGYRFLAGPEQHKKLVIIFGVAGFFYSFLAVYEVRMSPQLNNMIYGFFPHSWLQHIRGDGYRPLVFLEHGLWLAIFFAMAIIAAIGGARIYPKHRNRFFLFAGWQFLTLFLSNSLGAFVIMLLLAPLVFFLSVRWQLIAAAAIGAIVLTYPALRERGLITGENAIGWAQSISVDRAKSLEFRMVNENALLEKASERPLFGWGGWGRARVFDEEGRDISVTDGYWIITFGVGGWVRYLSEFGLLVLPLGLLLYHRKRLDMGLETATLGLMLTANLIDIIPNAAITPLTWLIVGALWGRIELGAVQGAEGEPATDSLSRVHVRYARDGRESGKPVSQRMQRYTRPKAKIDRRGKVDD